MAKQRPASTSAQSMSPGVRVGLAVLAVYLVVLVIGVAGELLNVQWIRNLPIY
ncbi:MAG: hypothetical protein OEY97_07475 [Nitrospirota bacterium]|nr:hypothetical protein [Nitrospirota bacterium]